VHFATLTIYEIVKDSPNQTVDQRALCLRVLARIGEQFPHEISSYDFKLGPLLFSLVDENQENSILRAVLMCFPRVTNPDPEKMKQVDQTHALSSFNRRLLGCMLQL
jgi:hypothetical protein